MAVESPFSSPRSLSDGQRAYVQKRLGESPEFGRLPADTRARVLDQVMAYDFEDGDILVPAPQPSGPKDGGPTWVSPRIIPATSRPHNLDVPLPKDKWIGIRSFANGAAEVNTPAAFGLDARGNGVLFGLPRLRELSTRAGLGSNEVDAIYEGGVKAGEPIIGALNGVAKRRGVSPHIQLDGTDPEDLRRAGVDIHAPWKHLEAGQVLTPKGGHLTLVSAMTEAELLDLDDELRVIASISVADGKATPFYERVTFEEAESLSPKQQLRLTNGGWVLQVPLSELHRRNVAAVCLNSDGQKATKMAQALQAARR